MDGSNLTPEGQRELRTYLDFFNMKKGLALEELQLEIQEFSSCNLQDTIYNKDDVQDLLQKLLKQLKILVDKEISKLIYMGGVYTKIFLSVSCDKDFHADFNFIENIKVIEEMKILEKGGNIIEDNEKEQKQRRLSKLPTLDIGQQKQMEQYQKDLDQLREYNQKLQNELILIKKDQSGDQKSAQQLQEELQRLQMEYEKLKNENDKKINESAQFQNLKKMLQEKNQRIKELESKI